jgi:hypothetical protein
MTMHSASTDLAEYRNANGGHPQTLTMLACFGPHDKSGWRPALIPQALVIDGNRPSWAEAPEIGDGDEITLNYKTYEVVQRERHNKDWYRLVPQFGPRFYVDFEGHGIFKIRDRENRGNIADYEFIAACRVTVGADRIDSWEVAQEVADMACAVVEG